MQHRDRAGSVKQIAAWDKEIAAQKNHMIRGGGGLRERKKDRERERETPTVYRPAPCKKWGERRGARRREERSREEKDTRKMCIDSGTL